MKPIERLLGADLVSKSTNTMSRVVGVIPACDEEEECEKFLYVGIEYGKNLPTYLPSEKIVEEYYVKGKCEKNG